VVVHLSVKLNPRRTYKKMADYLFEEVQHAYTAKQIFGALKRRHMHHQEKDQR
jgi:hypothetical protein